MARRGVVDLEKLAVAHEALQAALDLLVETLPVAAVDGRMTTSLRIEPDKLFALKTLAHHRRTRVNTLIEEAIDHYLELHSQPKEAALMIDRDGT
jgi:hypothetical protein